MINIDLHCSLQGGLPKSNSIFNKNGKFYSLLTDQHKTQAFIVPFAQTDCGFQLLSRIVI